MSIAQEIEHYATGLGEAYDAVEAKFGTVTGDKNLDNLDAAIDTIPAGIPREVDENGYVRVPQTMTSYKFPDKMKVLSSYAYYCSFRAATNLVTIDFNNVERIIGSNAATNICFGCNKLTNVIANNFKELSGTSSMATAFRLCSKLVTVSFPALKTISGANSLQGAFRECTALTTVSFPALTTVGTSYTNQFNNMLQQTSDVVVHFPAAMQSVIGSWTDVTAGFGGTNTTVLFDL